MQDKQLNEMNQTLRKVMDNIIEQASPTDRASVLNARLQQAIKQLIIDEIKNINDTDLLKKLYVFTYTFSH